MGSIAANTESRSYGTFFASTKVKYAGEPKDSVYKVPTTWDWIKGLSDVGGKAGGERIEFPVMLGGFNGSTDLAFGSLDTVTPQDSEISTIGWVNWATKAMAVGISEQKMKANEGIYRKYNYVKGQLDQAIRGQNAEFNTDAWATSQDPLKITSIANVISTTTGSGSPLNLSRATYTKWNQIYTNLAGAAFTTAGLNGMRTAYHSQSKGPTAGMPDTIFCSPALHAIYERITDGRERTELATSGKGKAPVLSEALVFRGCKIYWEPTDYPNDTTMRMLLSETWHWSDFESQLPGDAKPPFNGNWWAYPVIQAGALWCDLLIRNGIIGNFTAA